MIKNPTSAHLQCTSFDGKSYHLVKGTEAPGYQVLVTTKDLAYFFDSRSKFSNKNEISRYILSRWSLDNFKPTLNKIKELGTVQWSPHYTLYDMCDTWVRFCIHLMRKKAVQNHMNNEEFIAFVCSERILNSDFDNLMVAQFVKTCGLEIRKHFGKIAVIVNYSFCSTVLLGNALALPWDCFFYSHINKPKYDPIHSRFKKPKKVINNSCFLDPLDKKSAESYGLSSSFNI